MRLPLMLGAAQGIVLHKTHYMQEESNGTAPLR